MEGSNLQLKSIWGNRWEPNRKWFYPAWLFYETTGRFKDYAFSVYQYFLNQQASIGKDLAQVLSVIGSLSTFIICFVFLTIPGCIALYKFFKSEKTYDTTFERKIKKFF